MSKTDAQARALKKYRAEKVKQLAVSFYPKDADLWEWVQAQPNKTGYIRELIRADMVRNGANFGENRTK